MGDINKVFLVGRCTRDAEMKYTSGGMAISKFAIAVNRSVKKGDKWEDEASFLDCAMFGKRAESVYQYLIKGQQVAIEGQLVQQRWEKDGQNHSKVEINVDNLQLVGGKKEASATPKDVPFDDRPYSPDMF